jgi:signal transduction histidine kinase
MKTWRRDVVEGVTYRFALAVLPALSLGLVARTARREWPLVAVLAVTLVAAATTLSRRLSSRARVAVIVGTIIWGNGFLFFWARDIPFHGTLIPMGAGFAALMGGPRWGWWTLLLTSAPWLGAWIVQVSGGQPPLDIAWPSQYLRVWFFITSLTAGLVATINHVTRHLETTIEHSEALIARVTVEARDVQALAGRVREAEETERRRLAHDLHDDFGQRLTALRMKLQLSKLRPDQRAAAIDDCIVMSEELMQDIRSFAHGLRPPLLDEVGLGPALRALVEAHIDPSASVKTIEVPERLPRLPPPIELAVYRVVQEAIANVVRHSGATRLSVAARVEDGEIVVWVIDNGRGFRPDQVHAAHEHLGLVSMRERASFAGGRLEVDSSPGRGTRLSLRVPVSAPTPAGPEPASPETAVTP